MNQEIITANEAEDDEFTPENVVEGRNIVSLLLDALEEITNTKDFHTEFSVKALALMDNFTESIEEEIYDLREEGAEMLTTISHAESKIKTLESLLSVTENKNSYLNGVCDTQKHLIEMLTK